MAGSIASATAQRCRHATAASRGCEPWICWQRWRRRNWTTALAAATRSWRRQIDSRARTPAGGFGRHNKRRCALLHLLSACVDTLDGGGLHHRSVFGHLT